MCVFKVKAASRFISKLIGIVQRRDTDDQFIVIDSI